MESVGSSPHCHSSEKGTDQILKNSEIHINSSRILFFNQAVVNNIICNETWCTKLEENVKLEHFYYRSQTFGLICVCLWSVCAIVK